MSADEREDERASQSTALLATTTEDEDDVASARLANDGAGSKNGKMMTSSAPLTPPGRDSPRRLERAGSMGDELEREMDDVIDEVTTRSGAGARVEGGDDDDVEIGGEGARAPRDAFERYLAPKFWFAIGDVNVFVSSWTLFLWGVLYVLILLLSSALMGGGVGMFLALAVVLAVYMGVLFACGYGTMIAHELAHIAVCKRFGGRVDEDRGILLWPLGALAFLHLDGLTLSQELLVTLAGPASHAPMTLFWYLLSLTRHDTLSSFSSWMAGLNAMLMCWHLLPCYPMDGSRILACCLLLTRKIRVEAAAWIVALVSYACSIAYIVASLGYGVSITAYFALENLDWVLGIMCVVATSHLVFLLRNDRVRDHPTFSRYEIVYDAYHAFEEASRPEVFL